MFRITIKAEPQSFQRDGKTARSNRRKREQLQAQVREWLATNIGFEKYGVAQRLYGRIIYFNADDRMVRDIHNIIKPAFDSLEGLVIDNDHQILHFEGIKLDMRRQGSWFEIEFLDSTLIDPNLLDGKTTWYMIEVGELPLQPSEAVEIVWSN